MKLLKTLGWLLLYALIFIVSSFLAGIFVSQLYFLLNLMGIVTGALDYFIIKYLGLSIIVSGVLIVALGSLTLVTRSANPLKYLQFRRMPAKDVVFSIITGIGFAIFITSLVTLVDFDWTLPDFFTEQMSESTRMNFPLVLLAVGFVVPFYEEFLFRGLIFKELQKSTRVWIAIILQGLLFGAFHLNWFQFSYAFPAGIILGWIFFRYQSIWVCILIHFAWNTTSALLSFLLSESMPGLFFWLLLLLGAGMLSTGLVGLFKSKAIARTSGDGATLFLNRENLD